MAGPKHLPKIAWSKRELLEQLRVYEAGIKQLNKEIERRGNIDIKHHGFAVSLQPKPGLLETGYLHFETAAQAYDAAIKEFPEDKDAAPYRVHPVYLGKDESTTPTEKEKR